MDFWDPCNICATCILLWKLVEGLMASFKINEAKSVTWGSKY